jgi:hypothetical protein
MKLDQILIEKFTILMDFLRRLLRINSVNSCTVIVLYFYFFNISEYDISYFYFKAEVQKRIAEERVIAQQQQQRSQIQFVGSSNAQNISKARHVMQSLAARAERGSSSSASVKPTSTTSSSTRTSTSTSGMWIGIFLIKGLYVINFDFLYNQ